MDQLTLRSSLKPALMKSMLWQGTILAALGAILLLLGGILLPPTELNNWGLPVFIVSIALITIGLLPYRRLRRLETKPYRIIVDKDWLELTLQDKTLLSIPWESIEKFIYIDQKQMYGIGIILKKPLPKQVVIYTKKRILFSQECDVFLPYFSKHAYQVVQKI